MLRKSYLTLLLSGLSLSCIADTNTEDYRPLIDKVGNSLVSSYVFPEVAVKYQQRMNKCLDSRCLDGLQDDKQVAKKLTEILNEVYADKHLHVFSPGQREVNNGRKIVKRKGGKNGQAGKSGPIAISKQEILEDNIGYIKYNMFPGTEEALKATRDAMIAMKDTKALIFDIREHRGGHPFHVDEIAGFLFTEPTHMLTTQSPYTHDGKPWKLISKPNQYAEAYIDKPVYLLTSERSGSAAEHFAMAMKTTGRAILVGETTGGWGHWGGVINLERGFTMFLPSGRAFNPNNKLGWEEIGVTPDIMKDDELSLDYALNRARVMSR